MLFGTRSWWNGGVSVRPVVANPRRSEGSTVEERSRAARWLQVLRFNAEPDRTRGLRGHLTGQSISARMMRGSRTLGSARRETIAFGRRTNAIVERLFLVAVWRNFVKGVSERKNDPTTPAMRLGLTDRPRKGERVLGNGLFPDREKRTGSGWNCTAAIGLPRNCPPTRDTGRCSPTDAPIAALEPVDRPRKKTIGAPP